MGNADTKLHFRKAVLQLTTKTQPIPSSDESFWSQFWGDHVSSISDVFVLLPASEVRALRESAPSNLATLCYKAVERLVSAADTGASTHQEQQAVLNCVRILTRVLPYIFEDPDWRGFFWSSLPPGGEPGEEDEEEAVPLAHSLINALCDLLFCPDFTVTPNKKNGPDAHEDVQSLDSCEYIWEAGVGAARAPPHSPLHDANRREILKLLLTCFSQIIYQVDGTASTGSLSDHPTAPAATSQLYLRSPSTSTAPAVNPWLCLFTSASNRHALPVFTSLLNTVCGYEPAGRGLPYNHLLFHDSRESLVEVTLQILITALDSQDTAGDEEFPVTPDNLFINYLSRIHREEDFSFVLRGFTRLLNNPLQQTYLPHSTRRVACHQELLVFFWKFCDYNKKFLFYVLKSSEVLEVLVPILYHLNDARADQSRVGLLHIGVFILLLLSGERNFGVRLNKPYTAAVPMDIPVFTGSHADLLIIVFHKIITTGHQRLQPLFDCLLTILVNVSPYIKSLSMVASNKLLHLLEAFCTPWFLFSAPHHHHLVFFLLETFNNIIQYQFDGNSNLVYTLIRKRQVFHSLANLPTDAATINRTLNSRRGGLMAKKWVAGPGGAPGTGLKMGASMNLVKAGGQVTGKEEAGDDVVEESIKRSTSAAGGGEDDSDGSEGRGVEKTACHGDVGKASESDVMDGALPAQEAAPGTHTCTLAALPRLDKMTEQESAHPTTLQLNRLTGSHHNGIDASSPCTTDLITALSPTEGNAPPLVPRSDVPPLNASTAPSVTGAADIATSFPAAAASNSDAAGKSKTPLSLGVGASVSSALYPPSPHASTKVQPPCNPHNSVSYHHHQQRRPKAKLTAAEQRSDCNAKPFSTGHDDVVLIGVDAGQVSSTGTMQALPPNAGCHENPTRGVTSLWKSPSESGSGGPVEGESSEVRPGLLGKLYTGRRRELLLSTDTDEDEELLMANDDCAEEREKQDGCSTNTDRPSAGRRPGSNCSSSSSSLAGVLHSCHGVRRADSTSSCTTTAAEWFPSASWVCEWKTKLPLQTIMRLLQVLVPQVEKICIDKGLTDESEILRFLQHGTLVGLLPVPHPILIRKYQANAATATWFRTYMWGIIYLRNVDPPIWYDTDVRLFEIQRV